MPNYVYRSKDPDCSGFEATEKLSDPAQTTCPNCEAVVYRAITLNSAGFKLRHGMKGDMRDYRDDLARFVGDPEAHVDGPRALKKLIDKRKRQGWQMGQLQSPTQPKQRSSMEIVTESYLRAKAKGFIPDAR